NPRDRATQRVGGIGQTEIGEAVATRTFERDPIPVAADSDDCDVRIGVVERNEPIDLPLQRLAKERLHPPQVAESFLTDVRDKRNRAGRSYRRLVHRTNYGDKNREPAAVVADTGSLEHATTPRNLDVGLFRKDRIEVGSEDEMRMWAVARPIT